MTTRTAETLGPQTHGFPHLRRPPITEVVCGFFFSPIPTLDVFEFGVYWDSRRDDYPDKQMRLGLLDGASLDLSSRAWLISRDDGPLLQQLQTDRFYVNWRRRGEDSYPHFSDREGRRGLRSLALTEFELFSEFCATRPTIGIRPDVERIELTKVDSFERKLHWSNIDELEQLLPITRSFTDRRRTDQITLSLSEREQLPSGWLKVQINSSNDEQGRLTAIRLESRASLAVESKERLTEAFERANTRLNEVFFRLVPKAQERFGIEESRSNDDLA